MANPFLKAGQHHTVVHYEGMKRLAIMVTPECGGDVRDQTWECVSMMRAILQQQGEPMALTMQTVFVANASDVPAIRKLFEAYFDEKMPLTLFVVQPPCDGAALAVEAWAIGTNRAEVGYHGPHLVTIEHDGLRWVYASAGAIHQPGRTAYEQSEEAFENLGKTLRAVGIPFRDVVRLWLYQGGITEIEEGTERYRELNRARSDFFDEIDFASCPLARLTNGQSIYPASTGIGTGEHGLVITSLAIQTEREDVEILSLENPRQMSAFDYPKEYSDKSPKFSRAMAIRMGENLTTWVSGTASIVDAETVHPGDVEKQTEQTLDNIENLISEENFDRLGWAGAGATLGDLAKIRVYVKHAEDYEKCRAVCEKRLGRVPSIYALAEVCRPNLLVEIEGVAFSFKRESTEDTEVET
jgi:enamine deaminase RidA (YjgF/YER057c/UK114 family)